MRPRIKMPIWVAVGLVVAAYLIRSAILRNGDFSLDATDVLVLVVLVLGIGLVAFARLRSPKEGEGESAEKRDDEDSDRRQ